MRILGIDPGIGTMGYGVIDHEKNKSIPVDFGVVTTPKEKSLSERLLDLEKSLLLLIEKYKPDHIAVEELFFTKNITTGIAVAEARGVILLVAVKSVGENVFEYTPNQIKLAITGTGSADKGQMQTMVQILLKLKTKPRPDDAADALAVAMCHAQTGRLAGNFKVSRLFEEQKKFELQAKEKLKIEAKKKKSLKTNLKTK